MKHDGRPGGVLEHDGHVRPAEAAERGGRLRGARAGGRSNGGKRRAIIALRRLDEAAARGAVQLGDVPRRGRGGGTAVLERAMRLFSRPLRPAEPGGRATRPRHSATRCSAHHVDAKAFSALVDDLVADLDLADSYTRWGWSPRRSNMGAKYGYREGFSDDEVEFLRTKRTELLREGDWLPRGTRARAPTPASTSRSHHTEYFRAMGRRKPSGAEPAAGRGGGRGRRGAARARKSCSAERRARRRVFAQALRVLTRRTTRAPRGGHFPALDGVRRTWTAQTDR